RRSKLNWEEIGDPPHSDMLAWYTELIALRKSCASLRSPVASAVFNECNGLFIMHRPEISGICNFGSERIALHQGEGEGVIPPESVTIVNAIPEKPLIAEAGGL